jgi:hypothetical protein
LIVSPPRGTQHTQKTLDPFELRELGEAISDHSRLASLVTPDHPSRPQTPTTTKEDNSRMMTPQGPVGASLPPIQMTTDQLQTLLQQLYQPYPSSQPKIEDPELYYGERAKLRTFLIQCKLKFNCEPSKFNKDSKKVNYASARCRGNAWAWIEPSMKEEGVSKYETWKDFKTPISRAFGEANSKEVARYKFKIIKQ